MGSFAGVGRFVGGTVGVAFLIVWVTIWSAGTLFFDGIFVRSVAVNHRATEWPTTSGTVLASHLREKRDSEGGKTHSAELRYAYAVQGTRYEGSNFRLGGLKGMEGKPARQIVSEHPAGRRVTVYYDPHNPSQAALDVGVGAGEGLMLLFLTPFNAIMLVSWYVAAAWVVWRRPPAGREAGGVRLIADGPRVRARIPRVTPLGAGLGMLLGTSFVGIFAAALGMHVMPPGLAVGGVWALVIAGSALVFNKVAGHVWSGRADLVIDPMLKRLTLPQTYGRRESMHVPFAHVREVAVVARVSRDSDGPTTTYEPTVRCLDPRAGYVKDAVLARWSDRAKADAFADWLRQKIGQPTNRPSPRLGAKAA